VTPSVGHDALPLPMSASQSRGSPVDSGRLTPSLGERISFDEPVAGKPSGGHRKTGEVVVAEGLAQSHRSEQPSGGRSLFLAAGRWRARTLGRDRPAGAGTFSVAGRGTSGEAACAPQMIAGASIHGLAGAGRVQDAESILSQAGSENFPVASRLFPRALRRHLMNIYGFARLVDDLGDEAPGDRLALLDGLSSELDDVFAGRRPSHPLLRRLADTVACCALPRDPFDRLIEANGQDQTVTRYQTFDDLLAYCYLSATPVGELVLRLAGACTAQTLALADATCIGLQLAEFWQDLGEDARKGRIYVPLEDLDRFGCGAAHFEEGLVDERFRRLMAFEVERARTLLERGRPLGGLLRGRVGLAVRLFTAGGLAALDDVRRRGYDTFAVSGRVSPPRLFAAAVPELALSLVHRPASSAGWRGR
jgi:squalene synthase HpnC